MMKLGQKITYAANEIRNGLENFMFANLESLSENERARIGILINQLGNSVPLRPNDFFDLSYSTGGSIVGLIITYLIVLQQFKDSAAPE